MPRPEYSIGVKGGATPKTLNVSILCGAALAPFTASTLRLRMPERGQIIGVTANVGQRGGTHATSTIQVQSGATALLTTPIDVAALTPGTPVEREDAGLTAAAANVAKDAELRVVVAVAGGTSPTWADCTLQIDYIPL